MSGENQNLQVNLTTKSDQKIPILSSIWNFLNIFNKSEMSISPPQITFNDYMRFSTTVILLLAFIIIVKKKLRNNYSVVHKNMTCRMYMESLRYLYPYCELLLSKCRW